MKATSPKQVRRTIVPAFGMCIVLVGAFLVSGSATGGQAGEPRAATCEFPGAGALEVPTDLAVTFPDTVAAGGRLTASGLTVTLAVPVPAVDALRAEGQATLSAAADLRLAVRQGESVVESTVTGSSTQEIPAAGALEMTVAGELAPVAVEAGTEVVVELTGLAPRLSAGNTAIDCTADPAAAGELARITVTGGATAPASAAPVEPAAAVCPGAVCTSLTVEGTSRVAKLGSDIVLAPGRFDSVAYFDGPDPGWPLRIEGDLRLPAVEAYFVIFRFMPSTSRVAFLPDGKATGRGRIVTPPGVDCDGLCVEVDLVVPLYIQLSDVEQDGVPLEVGDTCATAVAAAIPMRGVIAGVGGPGGTKSELEATYEIPPFGGCGTAEDLDPLLTGLVSGPGNVLKTTLTVIPPEPA